MHVGSDSVVVPCPSCGRTEVDAALVELHRDRRRGFTLAAFLCSACGEVATSRCPEVVAACRAVRAPERVLVCTSPPAVPDPS
jgi:predicted RNA-binding Zn-ribbon protein involved in translation (DUF1610 family)